MKTPRVEDFQPKAAAERPLATPLDGMPTIEKPRRPADLLAPVREKRETANTTTVRRDERPPIHATLNGQQPKTDKFEKYSTYLRPGYLKKIQFLALDKDCADYEIVDEALTQYFSSLKK